MSISDQERKILIDLRLSKAKATYDDALFNLDAERYSTAANRMYYAVFHACGALLLSIGREANRHSGLRSMIGQYFIKDGPLNSEDGALIHEMFIMRQKCDYDDFIEIERSQVEQYKEPVKDLIQRIENILNVNS